MILRHAEDQIAIKGEYIGIREMRKHVAGIQPVCGTVRESGENLIIFQAMKN